MVVCTHDLREAAASCDRVVILEHGRVLAAGTPEQLALQVDATHGLSVTVGAGARRPCRGGPGRVGPASAVWGRGAAPGRRDPGAVLWLVAGLLLLVATHVFTRDQLATRV